MKNKSNVYGMNTISMLSLQSTVEIMRIHRDCLYSLLIKPFDSIRSLARANPKQGQPPFYRK